MYSPSLTAVLTLEHAAQHQFCFCVISSTFESLSESDRRNTYVWIYCKSLSEFSLSLRQPLVT
jgi:hypothetical protein